MIDSNYQTKTAEEVMSIASAAKNCNVSKKTVGRWAKKDNVTELYGKTKDSNIARAVPVNWVREKMKMKGIRSEPIYDKIEIMDDVSFNNQSSDASSKIDEFLPQKKDELPIEFVELIRKFSQVYEEHSKQVQEYFQKSQLFSQKVNETLRESQKESSRNLSSVRKILKFQNIFIAAGIVFFLVGIGLVVRFTIFLNENQKENNRELKEGVGKQLAVSQNKMAKDIKKLREENRMLKASQEERTKMIRNLKDEIATLKGEIRSERKMYKDDLTEKEKNLNVLMKRLEKLEKTQQDDEEKLKKGTKEK